MEPSSISQTSFPILTISLAKEVAARAASYSSEKGWKMVIAIVNGEGNLSYFERADDSFVASIEVAVQKARCANAFRRPTKMFAEAIKAGKQELLTMSGICAMPGGLPIVIGGCHVGAIGVSGSTSQDDEECASFAVQILK